MNGCVLASGGQIQPPECQCLVNLHRPTSAGIGVGRGQNGGVPMWQEDQAREGDGSQIQDLGQILDPLPRAVQSYTWLLESAAPL